MSLLVRTTAPNVMVMNNIRAAIAALDKDQPVYGVQTLEQALAQSVAPWRFYALLLGCFAGLALALAALGIYGVISYSVVEREREMGIRMALGARSRDVLTLVLRQAMTLVLTGILLGVAASYALTRSIAKLLYGVEAHDPSTYLAVSLLLLSIALLAAYRPARQATRVDPLVALRSE